MEQSVTVGEVAAYINQWAPFASAEEWDNVGLLVGSALQPVSGILTALDVTPAVVKQAAACGASLIVSHHPVIFRRLSALDGEGAAYAAARHGMAAIAAHTNLDKAPGGVNDLLAARLGLENVMPAPDGLCRAGTLPSPLSPAAFARYAAGALALPAGILRWADGGRDVYRVAVCGGAGGDCLPSLPPDTDAFVTGELHYHEWPPHPALTLAAAGHFYTEAGIAGRLAERLAAAFPSLPVRAADESCPYRTTY